MEQLVVVILIIIIIFWLKNWQIQLKADLNFTRGLLNPELHLDGGGRSLRVPMGLFSTLMFPHHLGLGRAFHTSCFNAFLLQRRKLKPREKNRPAPIPCRVCFCWINAPNLAPDMGHFLLKLLCLCAGRSIPELRGLPSMSVWFNE